MPGSGLIAFKKSLILFSLFAVAMAFLESTVVVYLREIFYPHGFKFPLVDIPPKIYIIELGREFATIVMIWTVSGIQVKNRREWFAFFAFNFAVWDIWYYIWLKIMLGWPTSLLEWDVLFLIPIPWIGPVLAPILVSVALILAALVILRFEGTPRPLTLTKRDWLLEVLAGAIIIGSFLTQSGEIAAGEVPYNYPWWIFSIGMALGLTVFMIRYMKRSGIASDPD